MGTLTGVLVLFVLLVPVSCAESFFTEPIICYFLDAFLMVYCIIFTALFFKEKFANMPPVVVPEDTAIYQELERPADADPYQVLEPSKRRKKAGKKKKPENQTQASNMAQTSL
ncbi:T-cell surface glycoprotein CD3 zeta chain-like isoform X2 [Parambassis ranga]|uniref:T-cell surface glycoprotein CD3 zeta chain-like isoform X2 n=1 Tax=Parambassis ranga TaxID=210632 RepID=A0A6P7HMQ4_9TELE|nr:T-cell surface glycoprotein CD3 zeta chain isoform X2 [Parambassis ranga]